MGGHLEGALGAQIVIDSARQFTADTPKLLYTNPLAALVQLCHQMHEAINRQSDTARSTVVMVWIDHHQAYWLNIGDSRLYHLRRGRRLMRTRDHSAVQLLMDLGEIDESQMASHPAQNRLYRSLGGEEEPKPDTGHFAVRSGDLLALCSDGVWEYINESELWDATFTAGPSTAALSLAQQAIQRGGAEADNATLILLRGNTGLAATPDWLQRVSAGVATLFGRSYR
jgi:serine/threonine protein phosphatase PrpC